PFVDARFPDDVHMPDDCPAEVPPPDDDPWPMPNFHRQTEWRPALKGALPPWDPDFAAGEARFAAWTRLLVEPRLPDGSYDPLSLGVPADSIGPAIGRGIGPPRRDFMTLSLEIGLRFVQAPAATPAWVLQDMQCWIAANGYA